MPRLPRFVRLVACLCVWSGCAGDSRGSQQLEQEQVTEERSEAAAASDVSSVAPLPAREWDEQDAKLLLSIVLKGMCAQLSGCDAWLSTALDLDANNAISFSAATRARLAELKQQRRSSGLSQRVLAIEQWEASALSDLESVSSIGLARNAVEDVLSGLLDRRVTLNSRAVASTAGLSAPAALSRTAPACPCL